MTSSAQLSPIDRAQIHLPFGTNTMLTSATFMPVFASDIALMAAFP